MTQHSTRSGRIFSKVADTYRTRPRQFCPQLYGEIAELCPAASGTCVLDVGCGTGVTTAILADVYQKVYGIDPSIEMLSCATEDDEHRSLTWVHGISEQLPFLSHAIDLITAAQAFHWFDGEAFLAEAKRVLRPRGLLAMFWKGPQRGEPYRTLMDQTIDRQLCVSKVSTPLGDVQSILSDGGFREVRVNEFDYDLEWTVDSYVSFMNSTSRMAQLGEKQREMLIPILRGTLSRAVGGDWFSERTVATLFTGRNPG